MDDATELAAGDPAGPGGRTWPGTRGWLAAAALAVAVACLIPPVSSLAGRYVLAETVQFACFAMVIPGLLVLGAPWRLLGLAGAPASRLARARERHPSFMRSAGFLAAFAALAVAWRVPPVIDAVARHPGLAAAELASLLITGVALWLELVPSPPLRPRGRNGLHLAVIAAFAMWLIWIIAYILGMATHGVFHAYRYHPGGPLSAVADQELATAVLWVAAAACFMPVIFTAAHRWLHDGDNVEAEMERVTGYRGAARGQGLGSAPGGLAASPGPAASPWAGRFPGPGVAGASIVLRRDIGRAGHGAPEVALPPGQRGDGGRDAGVAVTHEFPGPGDADEQGAGQDVADRVDRRVAVRVRDRHDARHDLDAKGRQQQHDQPELTLDPSPRHGVGQDGPHPAEGEQDAADRERGGRIADLVVRHQAEEGDRQGVGERDQRRRRADLPDDVGTLPRARPGSHREGHEQQAGERAR